MMHDACQQLTTTTLSSTLGLGLASSCLPCLLLLLGAACLCIVALRGVHQAQRIATHLAVAPVPDRLLCHGNNGAAFCGKEVLPSQFSIVVGPPDIIVAQHHCWHLPTGPRMPVVLELVAEVSHYLCHLDPQQRQPCCCIAELQHQVRVAINHHPLPVTTSQSESVQASMILQYKRSSIKTVIMK